MDVRRNPRFVSRESLPTHLKDRYPHAPVLTQGLPAPVMGAMAENAALFLSYRELQNMIKNMTGYPTEYQLPIGQLMIAAAGAGAITSFVL